MEWERTGPSFFKPVGPPFIRVSSPDLCSNKPVRMNLALALLEVFKGIFNPIEVGLCDMDDEHRLRIIFHG